MANIITNQQVGNEIIQMSNASTSIFFETLCISGADLAKDDYEKNLLIWLGQRDWTIMGMGVEGFDIEEIVWDEQIFEKQQIFLLNIIDQTINKTNWQLLE